MIPLQCCRPRRDWFWSLEEMQRNRCLLLPPAQSKLNRRSRSVGVVWFGCLIYKFIITLSLMTTSNRLERRFFLLELVCRRKYFWAWLATWVGVLVETNSLEIPLQSPFPRTSSPFRNFRCSSSVHGTPANRTDTEYIWDENMRSKSPPREIQISYILDYQTPHSILQNKNKNKQPPIQQQKQIGKYFDF